MSRRVRRRLNENPLDQWTPATVAAAQANRARTYGMAPHIPLSRGPITLGMHYSEELYSASTGSWTNWAQAAFNRGYRGDYTDPNSANGTIRPDWRDYAAARAGWSRAQHISNFGRVVQTFRQAVARIVRRAKWRRIIRALKLRARDGHGLHTRTVLYQGRPGPSMWPQVRHNPNWNPGLRGTGTRGHFYDNPNPNP